MCFDSQKPRHDHVSDSETHIIHTLQFAYPLLRVDRFNDYRYYSLFYVWAEMCVSIKIKYGFKLFGCVFSFCVARTRTLFCGTNGCFCSYYLSKRTSEWASRATWWYCNWWICSSFYTMLSSPPPSSSYVDQHISWFLREFSAVYASCEINRWLLSGILQMVFFAGFNWLLCVKRIILQCLFNCTCAHVVYICHSSLCHWLMTFSDIHTWYAQPHVEIEIYGKLKWINGCHNIFNIVAWN